MDNNTEILQEQIDAWKAKHAVYLFTGDGKKGYIKDPFSDFLTAQQVMMAWNESDNKCAWAILNNCWLGGDEDLRKTEKYGNGMAYRLNDYMDFPASNTKEVPGGFEISSGESTVKVRKATRDDISEAEVKNSAGLPYMTNAFILESICTDNADLEALKMSCSRDYIGILFGVRHVKDVADVTVKKL